MYPFLRRLSLFSIVLALCLGVAITAVQAADVIEIDIKPCKDPNILSVNEIGWLPVAIPYEYGVDPGTTALADVLVTSWVEKEEYLLVKFNAGDVIANLGSVQDGDKLTLVLTGKTYDSISIVGYDEVIIRLRGRASKLPASSKPDALPGSV